MAEQDDKPKWKKITVVITIASSICGFSGYTCRDLVGIGNWFDKTVTPMPTTIDVPADSSRLESVSDINLKNLKLKKKLNPLPDKPLIPSAVPKNPIVEETPPKKPISEETQVDINATKFKQWLNEELEKQK